MEGDLCLTMSIFGNQDALPDMANRAWLPGRRALPMHPSSCHSPPEAEYCTAKCLTPVAILPRLPGRLEGDALGKEIWWNEAACNPDASDHKTAFSLIFGS
jgi:hypothetical protein